MLFSFLLNCSNGSFLSPITWCAREVKVIIPFLENSINNCTQPTPLILFSLNQLLPLSKPSSPTTSLDLTAAMSSKLAKVAKNKHGVKVMGLKKDSSESPSVPKTSAMVESQETLNLQPLQHEPPRFTKPDFAKK